MQIKITNETKEIIINFDEKEKEDVLRQVRACMEENFYYAEIQDVDGTVYLIPSQTFKMSTVTIK